MRYARWNWPRVSYWRTWLTADGGMAGYSVTRYGWLTWRRLFWLTIGWWVLGGLWLAAETALLTGGTAQVCWALWRRWRAGQPFALVWMTFRLGLGCPAALRPGPLPDGVTPIGR